MGDNANCKSNRRSWARGRACLPLFAAAATVTRIEALLSPQTLKMLPNVCRLPFACTIGDALLLILYVGNDNGCLGSFYNAGVLHVSLQNSRLVKVTSTFVRGNAENAFRDMNRKPQYIQSPLSVVIVVWRFEVA